MSTIDEIVNWFEQAVPEPTDANKCVQIGCHFEEVYELSTALFGAGEVIDSPMHALKVLADELKSAPLVAGEKFTKEFSEVEDEFNKKEMLDALCDQIVTAIGVAHMFGFDIRGALAEVSRSNNSKFVDGKPVFNEQGKIAKPETYSPPDLTPYL